MAKYIYIYIFSSILGKTFTFGKVKMQKWTQKEETPSFPTQYSMVFNPVLFFRQGVGFICYGHTSIYVH